ncbi:hypothetical protein [Gaoshiqia sediminis]|uniref:Uncharacterized protein n=1 Tax=Gaoshiqia sediminis TaxID=2986998 RepID=A0AA41YAX8_9BACT|nr:hypothetical protein [Gaoshiqia sediminis]MCW0484976.1 hypothetical protein [Gaoshiqia sediminis]
MGTLKEFNHFRMVQPASGVGVVAVVLRRPPIRLGVMNGLIPWGSGNRGRTISGSYRPVWSRHAVTFPLKEKRHAHLIAVRNLLINDEPKNLILFLQP